MANYYVRPTNGNDSNAGTSFGAAFKTTQKGLDTAVAGDNLYLVAEAEEVIAAAINDNVNSGVAGSGGETVLINIIGVNSAGVNDGTRYVINGNSAAASCIIMNGVVRKVYKNIQVKNATSHGINFATTTVGVHFYNVVAHNNGGSGFDNNVSNTTNYFVNCCAYLNAANGWGTTNTTTYYQLHACAAYLNGNDGFQLGTVTHAISNCIAFKNTRYGISGTTNAYLSINNCILDSNLRGINFTSASRTLVAFCRLTNNTTAIQATTGSYVSFNNYYFGNTNKFLATTGEIRYTGTSVDMASDGYTDKANNDYSLLPSAEGRRIELEFCANKFYLTGGISGKDIIYPNVTSITPSIGSVNGLTDITITGIGLTGATGATVKGVAVTDFTVVSDTSITAKTAAMTAGQGDVVVLHPSGNMTLTGGFTAQSGATAPGAFTLSSTSKANGYLLLEWTPSAGANNYDVYVNGSIPTGYSNLTVCKKVILLSAETTYSIYVNAKNDTGNTASNTVSVTTGKSDCITAAITQNIITALEKITVANGYSFTVNTVEQERATERINNRLPMLEVCGPAVTIEDKTTQGKKATCGYSVVYRNLLNDDDLNSDPVTTQSQNIAADIIIALMDDHTLGGNAVMIKITDHYHDLDDSGNTTMFNVIVSFEVETFIDMFNPYKIG